MPDSVARYLGKHLRLGCHPGKRLCTPTDSVARYLGKHLRVYRFALYGRSAAGKTCFLAALNMNRRKHPCGYVCDRLPELNGIPCPKGNPEEGELHGDPVKAFYAGARKLTEVEKALQRGTAPPPTPRQPPYLIVYTFTDPNKGKFHAELIDYAGELTDPNLINDPEKMVDLLQCHIQSVDGLLVLVDVPRQGREEEGLPKELQLLRQSVDQLNKRMAKGTKWSIPVALILSKWDHRGKPDASDAERRAEVKAFLDGPDADAFNALDSALRGITSDPDHNYAVFAASAFGEARTTTVTLNGEHRTVEVPANPNKLASFGLEDPFIWVIERRNAIDLEAYRKAIPTSRLRRWFNPLLPLAPLWWWRRAQRLSYQLPKDTPEQQEVQRAKPWHLAAVLTRSLTLLLFLGVIAAPVETWGMDWGNYRRVEAVLSNPRSTSEDKQWAKDWLHAYATSWPVRHWLSNYFVLPKKDALKRWTDLQVADAESEKDKKNRTNEDALEQLEIAFQHEKAKGQREEKPFRDLFDKVNLLPPHPDAETDVLRTRRRKLRDEVSSHLTRLAADSNTEKVSQNLGFLAALSTRIEKAQSTAELKAVERDWEAPLPYPEAIPDKVRAEQEKVRQVLAARRESLAREEDWTRFEAQVDKAIREEQFPEAARLLVHRRDNEPRLDKLRSEARTRIVNGLNRKQEELCRDGSFSSALKLVEDTLENADLVRLFDHPDQDRVRQMIPEVKTRWGRSLYSQLQKGKTLEDVDRYLESRADQRMAQCALEYRTYLTKLSQPLDLTIKLAQINWADWWDGYVNNVQVKFVGEGDNLLFRDDVVATQGGSSSDVGQKTVRRKPTERVELRVWVWNSKGFAPISTRPAGTKTYQGELRMLHEKVLTLEDDESRPAKGATVRFEVGGIPKEPDLPPWKD